MAKSKYTPISCSFYDELEALATLRKTCTIRYKDEQDEIQNQQAIIKDFFIRDKVEYMLLNNGDVIRLDYLIEVDGKVLNKYC